MKITLLTTALLLVLLQTPTQTASAQDKNVIEANKSYSALINSSSMRELLHTLAEGQGSCSSSKAILSRQSAQEHAFHCDTVFLAYAYMWTPHTRATMLNLEIPLRVMEVLHSARSDCMLEAFKSVGVYIASHAESYDPIESLERQNVKSYDDIMHDLATAGPGMTKKEYVEKALIALHDHWNLAPGLLKMFQANELSDSSIIGLYDIISKAIDDVTNDKLMFGTSDANDFTLSSDKTMNSISLYIGITYYLSTHSMDTSTLIDTDSVSKARSLVQSSEPKALDDALQQLTANIDAGTDLPASHYIRGYLWLERNNPEKALSDFKTAYALGMRSWPAGSPQATAPGAP